MILINAKVLPNHLAVVGFTLLVVAVANAIT